MKKTLGFSQVFILIIAAFFLVSGLIAWRIISSKTEPTSPPAGSQEEQPKAQGTTEQPSAEKRDDNSGYLVINEWNVRFKIPEGVNDVQYVLHAKDSNDEAIFTTQEIAALDESCSGESTSHTPLGALFRSKKATNEYGTGDGSFIKRIGDYYYTYLTPQSACGDSKEGWDLQVRTLKLFKPAINLLEEAR